MTPTNQIRFAGSNDADLIARQRARMYLEMGAVDKENERFWKRLGHICGLGWSPDSIWGGWWKTSRTGLSLEPGQFSRVGPLSWMLQNWTFGEYRQRVHHSKSPKTGPCSHAYGSYPAMVR